MNDLRRVALSRRTGRAVALAVLAVLAVLGVGVAVLAGLAAPPAARAATIGTGPASAAPRTAAVFSGLGTWVDLWDYDPAFAGSHPVVSLSGIDRMASRGVQTLYLQAARPGGPTVSNPALVRSMISRAHARGLKVVLWYLPTTRSVAADLAHLRALAALPADGVAIDAESAMVTPVSVRNQRLVSLTAQLRAATGKPLAVITPSPTAMALWAPKTFWPGYPFARLAPFVDAFMTMSYWNYHSRVTTAAAEVTGDVTRLRAALGDSARPIHVIGWPTNAADVRSFVETAKALRIAGGSVYDYGITPSGLWPVLGGLRQPGTP